MHPHPKSAKSLWVGEEVLVLLGITDINSMCQLTLLDKRFAQESSVKSRIVDCSINLLEKLSFRNQTTEG